MAEKKYYEKREYVRAYLGTQVMVKPVSREEFERTKGMYLDGAPGSGAPREGNKSQGLPPDSPWEQCLAEHMSRIEEKLNRILRKLEPDTPHEETVTRGSACNISGAGVNLMLEEPLVLGQLVLLSLSIPGFSIGFLHAYGEVVRVSPCNEGSASSYNTSFKFVAINETEREMLISYAFYRQRRQIRGAAARETDQELLNNGR